MRSLLYGEEMYTLAQTLEIFHLAKKVATIAAINLPSLPYEGNNTQGLLRPTTWQAIASLNRVVEETQLSSAAYPVQPVLLPSTVPKEN